MAAESTKELEALLAQEETAWTPEPGEVLSGVVVNIEQRKTKYGPYPAVTIRPEEGNEVVFHAFRTVAKNKLAQLRPVVGDLIAVLYMGELEGNDYHGYRIRLNRTSGRDFNWDQFDTDPNEGDTVTEAPAA